MSKAFKPEQGITSEALIDIFNLMDVQILITDAVTDEILYANQKMNRGYNIESNPIGKRCWEAYQINQNDRCIFCPLHTMSLDNAEPVIWESYNTASKRWFRNTSSIVDWTDGRKVHLEQGVDITEIKKNAETLKRRLGEQKLIGLLLQLFLSMEDTVMLMNQAFQKTAEYLLLDRVMLIQLNDNGGNYAQVKGGWYVSEDYDLGEAIELNDTFRNIINMLVQRRLPHIKGNDLTCDEQYVGIDYGIKDFLYTPVYVDGNLWGILGFEMCSELKELGESDVYLAKMLANLIGGVLEREIICDNMNKAEERTKVMLDASPLACTMFDQEGEPIDCNKEAVLMFEKKNKEDYIINYHSLSPEFQPDGALSSDALFREIMLAFGDGHRQLEWLYILDSGEELPVELTLERIMWRDSFCVAAYARDLRREREAAAITKEAETRTQLMLDVTPMVCTFFDQDGMVIDCNEEAAVMYGLSDKHEYVERFDELSSEYQLDGSLSGMRYRELIQRAFTTGEEIFEWNHNHADGSIIPVEITLRRVKWKDEYRVAGYARDLRQIKAKIAQLEKTQEKLRSARDKAEESARAKSTFLANMSHEIRTPMNAIIGMTNIARGSSEPERVQYCLGKVQEAATHLLGVINDVLDMSKIDAGKLELNTTDFLLDKMLQRVSDITNFRTEQRHQDFVIKVDKDVPKSIVTDQQRLAQVITNLLSNAVRFTPEGGKIGLYVHNEEDGEKECTLLFEVIDTGIGISDDQKSRLFQSFEQADGSISRRFGGTGLGLAISKNIVEKMGGEIGVDSKPQEGAAFHFTVKVKKGRKNFKNNDHIASSQQDKETDSKQAAPEKNKGILSAKRILMAEDIDINQEIMMALLEETGVEIECADNGKIACDMFLKCPERYDMILMDIHMPEMDGYRATQTIRAMNISRAIDIPIIAMTANVFREDVERCLAAGMDDHIGKPVDRDELINKLKRYLIFN